MIRIILMVSLAFGVGCSSLGRKLDAERAQKVRKVAILSFEIQQQQPTDNLGLGKLKELKAGRPGDSAELKKMAENVLEYTRAELGKKTGWRVVETATVKNGGAYAAKNKDATTGLHAVSMSDGYSEIVLAPGILDNVHFRKMSHAERAKLAKEAGADAFAEVVIYQTIEQSRFSLGHLSGDAAFALRARSNMMVYGLESEDPIWRIQNVDGVTSPRSDTMPEGHSKLQRLAKLGEQAAHSSLNKMLETYQTK